MAGIRELTLDEITLVSGGTQTATLKVAPVMSVPVGLVTHWVETHQLIFIVIQAL